MPAAPVVDSERSAGRRPDEGFERRHEVAFIGPVWILQEHLAAKLIRDAEPLDGTDALDARGPAAQPAG